MHARRRSNRRQFLKGESAIEALNELQWSAVSSDQSPLSAAAGEPQSARDYLLQVGRRAMACDFHVFLNAGQHVGAVEAASEALDLVERLEDQMTIYRAHSEVSGINRDAFERACVVEAGLFELFCRCVAWNAATSGALDITAGPLVKLWGFHTRTGCFPAPEQIREVLQRVGSQYLELDREPHTIRFLRRGMELNLGSVGKGYALDRCADVLAAANVGDFLIHGGNSSVLARGSRYTQSDAPEWRIALRHPLRPERRLAELKVCNRGVGTSGSGQQFFYHRGHRYGHVLDPRSGVSVEGIWSVTVLAPDAAEADALATAFFVLGVDATQAYCESRPDLAAIFVLPGTRAGTVSLESIGVRDQLVVLDD